MQKVCTIIPVYNEGKRLQPQLFLNFLELNPSQSIVFVNDGSSDTSQEVIDALIRQNLAQIHTVILEKNSGKAEAVRQGILYSIAQNTFDYVGYLDADLACPLSQIDHICSEFDKSTHVMMAFGSRVKLFGRRISRNLSRHYLGRIFATYVSILFRLSIYDTQCGAKYFRQTDFIKDIFRDTFVSRWFFDIEIIIRYRNVLGKKLFETSIIEVPLKEWEEKGESKLQFKDYFLTPYSLHQIKKKYS